MHKIYFNASTQSIKLLTCCLIVSVLSSCATSRKQQVKQISLKSISRLKYINQFVVPNNTQLDQVNIGGLSGIDYDEKENVYYLICDDRSHLAPARFYKARIDISAQGINQVSITNAVFLRQENGAFYPPVSVNATKTVDPEAMRMNWKNRQLVWTSEGDRVFKAGDTLRIDPSISWVDTNGKFKALMPLPENLKINTTENGPRRNGVLEGLSFADHFKNLYVSLEEPRYEDGPRPGLKPSAAYVRIYKFDLQQKKNIAQYAYQLDPVPLSSTTGGAINNGISDILWWKRNNLLVTERAFSEGRNAPNIRVFLAELKGAANVIQTPSLIARPPAKPIAKKLLLDMDKLGIYIDNIEGATFGPVLANGHQSLIFVADNNYKNHQHSQFLLFEVIP